MTEAREYWWVDTTLCVSAPGTKRATYRLGDGRRIDAGHSTPDWLVWTHLMRALKRLGYSNEADPKVKERHPCLVNTHRYGRRGDLEWVGETYPTGCKVEFFQNLVTENRNGGRYDFQRLEKMPVNVRRHFTLARRALEAALAEVEIPARPETPSPIPDPLAYFNGRWDSAWDRKAGRHRFERGPDGWPTDREMSSQGRRDADGAVIRHGEIRYARDRKGFLQRGRVYGGINGMWLMVYGPGAHDFTHHQARSLFAWRPGLARKAHPSALPTIKRRLKAAVEAEDFEAAARLRDARRRIEPPPAQQAAE